MKYFLLYGGGGHAKVVIDAIRSFESEVLGIFDDSRSGELMGIPFSGQYSKDFYPDTQLIVSIGDNYVRHKVVQRVKHSFGNVCDRSSLIAGDVLMGSGNMLLHRCVVQPGTRIGNHVIINTAAVVDHDCQIGNFVHVAPGAVLCGNVKVGEGALLGAGCVVLPGVSIGEWAVVGAGAVVVSDVEKHTVVTGSPARYVKKRVFDK